MVIQPDTVSFYLETLEGLVTRERERSEALTTRAGILAAITAILATIAVPIGRSATRAGVPDAERNRGGLDFPQTDITAVCVHSGTRARVRPVRRRKLSCSLSLISRYSSQTAMGVRDRPPL